MRAWVSLALLVASIPVSSAEAEDFPYSAVVESDDAAVRSGPGEQYYSTDALPRGAVVQVYRRDGEEWLGIRPPEGSFSWVPAEQLQIRDDSDLAVVGPEGAIAWVGARIGRVSQHKWQVKLEPDETVQILSDKRYLASMGMRGEGWFKIAAPSGEFRWIHQRDVKRVAPAVARKPDQSDAEPPGVLAPLSAELSDSTESSHIALRRMDPPEDKAGSTGISVVSVDHQVPVADESSDRDAHPHASDGFVARRKDRDSLAEATATSSTRNESEAVSPVADSALGDEIRSIELELSTVVVQPRSSWNLTELIGRAEALIEQGATAVDRGRARLLLDKLKQFQSIQRGVVTAKAETTPAADALFVPPQQLGGSSEPIGPSSNEGVVSADASRERFEQMAEAGRYDGAGWLLPVHSQLQIAPRFALTDDQGRVIQYVIPAPGRNLHRHLRKQVGIIGHRQAVTGLGAPVLTASNVIELERHR